MFSSHQYTYRNESWLAERTMLTTQNQRPDSLHAEITNLIPESLNISYRADTVENKDKTNRHYPTEIFLSIPGTNSFSHHILYLFL